jgi:tetratricopeptide (TPR) repeat protein
MFPPKGLKSTTPKLRVHYFEGMSAAAQRIDHLWFKGMIRAALGHVTCLQGKFAPAREHYFESGLFFRRMGARSWEATLLNLLGDIARAEGEIDQALASYQACIDLYQELGNVKPTYWAACNLGHALLR